jgi:hypothetical protein
VIGQIVREEPGPLRRHRAGQQNAHVLEQERHAPERAFRQPRGNGVAAMVVELLRQGIDLRIVPLGAFDRRIEQLRGAGLATRHQFGEPSASWLS